MKCTNLERYVTVLLPYYTCVALRGSAAAVARCRHHVCTNQGTVKRRGSIARARMLSTGDALAHACASRCSCAVHRMLTDF